MSTNASTPFEQLRATFGSPSFAAAMTTIAIAVLFLGGAIRAHVGWPGYVAALVTAVLFAAAAIVARRDSVEWRSGISISLLLFLAWCAGTVVWSINQGSTLAGTLYQVAVAFLAVAISLLRDLIQIVRAFGDVLRGILAASLILEIFAGALIDSPIPFLGIQGNFDEAGPLQGLLGSRNMLGFVALIAAVTFAVELATRSVGREVAIASLVLAGVVIALTRSPVTFAGLLSTAVLAATLIGLRRAKPENRTVLQFGLVAVLIIAAGVGYFLRERIIDTLNARGELDIRLDLWSSMRVLINLQFLEGWGWNGLWNPSNLPFSAINAIDGREHVSGLNAYLDVWLQVGIVGLIIFVAFVGLAVVRAWIAASTKRSPLFIWPALVLILVAVTSLAESAAITEFGWFTLVLGATVTAKGLSWKRALAAR